MQRPSLTPGRSPSNESALQGATLAFRSSPSPSNRNAHISPSTSIGALAAASRASSPALSPSASINKSNTLQIGDVSSITKRQSLRRSLSQIDGAENTPAASIKREVSPSYIAATRAASRSRSQISTTRDEPLNSSRQQSKSSPQFKPLREAATDETSIPPTSRLVELFEAKQRAELPSSKTSEKELILPANDNILSPTPTRPSLSIRLRAPTLTSAVVPDPIKSKNVMSNVPKNLEKLVKKRPASTISMPTTSLSEFVGSGAKIKQLPPPVPAPRRSTQNKTVGSEMLLPPRRKTPQRLLTSPSQLQNGASKPAPAPPAPRQKRPASVGPTSSKPLSPQASIPPVLPRRISHLQLGTQKPQLTAESLANAIVASSLASSRAPSPARSHKPEPIFPQHSGKAYSITSLLLLHSPTHPPSQSKTLLKPTKPAELRQTLRHTISSSEEEDPKHRHRQHKHGLLVKKHPNKHAEGSRRRWRDSITEHERKRYEGVWAANKGILVQHESTLDPTATRDDVHGFVVRDIWSRSGLSVRTLREIWDLVESGGLSFNNNKQRRGRLKKHEFVVGLWLVDQCLKGRKLPTEVQESVWNSAKDLMSGFRAR